MSVPVDVGDTRAQGTDGSALVSAVSDASEPNVRASRGSRSPRQVRHPRITGAATPDKLVFAREQRRQPTRAEDRLWQALRGNALGVRFRRQHPVGDFVLDFYCEKRRLAVEIDGPIHDQTDTYDRWRDGELARTGIRTLRLRAVDVEGDVDAAVAMIWQAVGSSDPATAARPSADDRP